MLGMTYRLVLIIILLDYSNHGNKWKLRINPYTTKRDYSNFFSLLIFFNP